MKKYLKMIPLMLYPYAYLIYILFIYFTIKSSRLMDAMEIIHFDFRITIVLFNLYVLFIAIFNAVITSKDESTSYEVAKMNLIIKGFQIPAYIFHFLISLVGLLMSVWGVGFIMIAIVVDLLSIILTGINSIGCTIKLKREGVINSKYAKIMGVGSFLYCVDLVIAIIYVVLCKKKSIELKRRNNIS